VNELPLVITFYFTVENLRTLIRRCAHRIMTQNYEVWR